MVGDRRVAEANGRGVGKERNVKRYKIKIKKRVKVFFVPSTLGRQLLPLSLFIALYIIHSFFS